MNTTVVVSLPAGAINLQATLSASSAGLTPVVGPHHPITCTSRLFLHEDGRFECEHATAPADDCRTQSCLDHSIAVLLIELLCEREGRG